LNAKPFEGLNRSNRSNGELEVISDEFAPRIHSFATPLTIRGIWQRRAGAPFVVLCVNFERVPHQLFNDLNQWEMPV